MKIIRVIKGIALMGGLIAGGSAAAQTLVWNGADGANWKAAGVWLDQESSETVDWTDGADVVFPANESVQEIALTENVTTGTITFNGSYMFTGGGKPTGTEIIVAGGTVTFPVSLPKQKMTIAEGGDGGRLGNTHDFWLVSGLSWIRNADSRWLHAEAQLQW